MGLVRNLEAVGVAAPSSSARLQTTSFGTGTDNAINVLDRNRWINQNFRRRRQFDLEEEVVVVVRLAAKVCL